MLPNNREGSLRRLASLNRKLKRQDLTSAYKEIIEEQREAGVVEKADGPCVGDWNSSYRTNWLYELQQSQQNYEQSTMHLRGLSMVPLR